MNENIQALLQYKLGFVLWDWQHVPSQDKLSCPFGHRTYDPGNKALTPAGHCFCPEVPLWFSTLSDLLSQYILMMAKNMNYAVK